MKVALDPARLAILNKKFETVNNQKREYDDSEKLKFYNLERFGRYVFRIMPMTADQNNFFGEFVGNHWVKLNQEEKSKFVPCVESYDAPGAICPVCEAFRELENLGIETKGFWKMRAAKMVAMKVLMIEAPNEYDLPMNKISILKVPLSIFQIIATVYNSPDSPDVLDPNTGVAYVLSRGENERHWNVKLLDSSMPQCGILGGSIENRDKLLADNENMQLKKIFKLPSDEKMMDIKKTAHDIKERIMKAKNTVDNSVSEMSTVAVSEAPAPIAVTKQIPIVNPLQQSVPTYNQLPNVVQPQMVVQQPMQMPMQQPVPVQNMQFAPNVQQPSFNTYNQGMQNTEVLDDEIPFEKQTVAETVTQQVKPVAAAPSVNIDYDNLTPQQKAIIEQYRDGCKMQCFGRHDKYDALNNYDCLIDPFSSNCALCIKALTGIDHTKELGMD